MKEGAADMKLRDGPEVERLKSGPGRGPVVVAVAVPEGVRAGRPAQRIDIEGRA